MCSSVNSVMNRFVRVMPRLMPTRSHELMIAFVQCECHKWPCRDMSSQVEPQVIAGCQRRCKGPIQTLDMWLALLGLCIMDVIENSPDDRH